MIWDLIILFLAHPPFPREIDRRAVPGHRRRPLTYGF
jgi:hypothetical protein